MDNSINLSINNETFKAKKIYLDKDPIENNIICPECLIHLKYFYISKDESIFKCQTENCWFPYQKFVYKNSIKKQFYFYEPIISNANGDSAPKNLNNCLLDIELNKKINDLKVDTTSKNLINDLDCLINEFNETGIIENKTNVTTETKVITPRRLTRCKEVIKNNEKLLNNNLVIKKQSIINKNNESLNSCDSSKKLSTNLSSKFKNNNLLSIINKEKKKIEAIKLNEVVKKVIKPSKPIIIVDEVVINAEKIDSDKSINNINENKPKECDNELDLSAIDFNLISDIVATNAENDNFDSKSIERKDEVDSFTYNENLLFYDINKHIDDNNFVDKTLEEDNKDYFDFSSLFNDSIDNKSDDAIILPSNNEINTIKIEKTPINDRNIIPDLLSNEDKSVKSDVKIEDIINTEVLGLIETKEIPTVKVKKGRKSKDNEAKIPMRRSARIRSTTK